MGTYVNAMQYARPSDKLIDWKADYTQWASCPPAALGFYGFAIPTYEDVPVLLRAGMGRCCGKAHIRFTPERKPLYYITMSKEWWRTCKKMLPEHVFMKLWTDTLIHEFAHVVTFTGNKRHWSHGEAWYQLTTAWGGSGDVKIYTRSEADMAVARGVSVSWAMLSRETMHAIKATKAAKLNERVAATAAKLK